MDIHLKGITGSAPIEHFNSLPVKTYAFDLRPKSFNFTSIKNINGVITSFPLERYRLIFENEAIFNIQEILKKITDSEVVTMLEICGNINFEDVDHVGFPYCWRFNEDAKFSDIKKAKNLDTIVLPHSVLEFYSDRGELFGFLNLFNDEHFAETEFELLLDWDSSLLDSSFEQLKFSSLSFEINSKVEISYQNPDLKLMKSEIYKTLNYITK